MPATSKLVEGEWWPADYAGPPLVSLHQSLRSGLGVKLGDHVTFDMFGDTIDRDDRQLPRLFVAGRHRLPRGLFAGRPRSLSGDAAGRGEAPRPAAKMQWWNCNLATALPDVRFVAIGETLEQITKALSQLSLAAIAGGRRSRWATASWC